MKNKLLYLIMIVIIIAGAIVVAIKGFKFDINFRATEMLEIYIGKEFEINDIKNITKEVLQGKEIKLNKIGEFENTVAITTDEITDEEKDLLIQKTNEKYELENKTEEVLSVKLAHTRLKDIIAPYILPLIIVTIIIFAYWVIVYRKVGIINVLVKAVLNIILPEATIVAIIALSRLPIAEYTIISLTIIYSILMLVYSYNLNKKLDKIKLTEKKK